MAYEELLSSWSNGSWKISWINADKVIIEGPYKQKCIMDGGDFGNALAALAAAFRSGQHIIVTGEK